jgi:hypothetical protein
MKRMNVTEMMTGMSISNRFRAYFNQFTGFLHQKMEKRTIKVHVASEDSNATWELETTII